MPANSRHRRARMEAVVAGPASNWNIAMRLVSRVGSGVYARAVARW
jgi:hypothetical protein